MASSVRRNKYQRCLLLIDPQNDFHPPNGALAVAGADKDADRIAALIAEKEWDSIMVTLDTHQLMDIGHPNWWVNEKGENPKPFVSISHDDVKKGVWRPVNPANQAWALEYTKKLEEGKRYQATIWPPHCTIGSWGHNVVPAVDKALLNWAAQNKKLVTYLFKGTNPKTEMYSCFGAEVPVENAPETALAASILNELLRYKEVYICGEALSHCVRYSTTHLIEWFAKENPKNLEKLAVLEDCSSPVTGFEDVSKEWLADIAKQGVRVVTSKDVI